LFSLFLFFLFVKYGNVRFNLQWAGGTLPPLKKTVVLDCTPGNWKQTMTEMNSMITKETKPAPQGYNF
jgi:hypothetical protein